MILFKTLRLARLVTVGLLTMAAAAAAQTTKPDADTTKKFEAAQKAETSCSVCGDSVAVMRRVSRLKAA